MSPFCICLISYAVYMLVRASDEVLWRKRMIAMYGFFIPEAYLLSQLFCIISYALQIVKL